MKTIPTNAALPTQTVTLTLEQACHQAAQHHRAGRFQLAERLYRAILQARPNDVMAHAELGNLLQAQGRPEAAEASYRSALRLQPDFAEVHSNLGNALQAQGRAQEAETAYRRALQLQPDLADAHSNLSITLLALGRMTEAEQACRQALRIRPDFVDALSNLSVVLQALGRLREVESVCQNALRLAPELPSAWFNLSIALREQGRLVEALGCAAKAVTVKPDYAEAHSNLATTLAYLSDFDQVATASNTAQQLQPNDEAIWEQRLYSFSYHPDLSAQDIVAEFLRWGDRFPDPVTDFSAHDRSPGRRLRIGYVSPDFRRHTSCFFFWPLFANHDPLTVELFAYSNVASEDDVTQDFKGLFPHWRAIRGVPDAEVARLIQADQIDILVDCCNHMRDARLGVFALKPAPIQATWLGAAWTTGLKAVDYALIDPYMAPAGTLTRETIVRLPHCFVAYRPPEQTADLAPSPCLKNGHITFGYSGRSERLNHHTFRVWGEILQHNPSARLILDFRTFADPQTQAHYRQFMARHGLNPSRVTLRNSANIFQGLNDIDVLLDSFPHSGGTMLFDALWMGVPVLTLASRPPVGRIGTSLMMNLGLPDWVAHSHAEYIAKAKALTQDVPALASLRAGMRQRLQASPIMDGVGFARGVEGSYRWMFEAWAVLPTPGV